MTLIRLINSAILAHELDGLQKITEQNIRLRVEPKLFCHSWAQYGDYPTIMLPDGRMEIALGDLVSEEAREFVLLTEVLPLPSSWRRIARLAAGRRIAKTGVYLDGDLRR
jgi:hypothetical protein